MYEAFTLYGWPSQVIPLILIKLLGCSAFARRYWRNLNWFLFLRVLRCFSSPRLPPYPMYSGKDNQLTLAGFPHSEISDYNGCLSPHQSLSQITTSFIASYRLGIHRMRLISWLYITKYSRPFDAPTRVVTSKIPVLTIASSDYGYIKIAFRNFLFENSLVGLNCFKSTKSFQELLFLLLNFNKTHWRVFYYCL